MSRVRVHEEEEEEEEDRMSNLPDSILIHILSSLPTTKDAVRSSVLSKRWLYLWTHLTNLHFDDAPHRDTKSNPKVVQFERFVSRVLLLNKNSCIHTFSLKLEHTFDPYLVSAWISSILPRNLKTLSISCHHTLPPCFDHIFTCYSLVDLVLILNASSVFKTLPSPFVHLPNLQTLELSGIRFSTQGLILSFPMLKKFKAKLEWWNFIDACLQAPLLEMLIVETHSDMFNLLRGVIKVCASNVREISHTGSPSPCFLLQDPSSALQASASISLLHPSSLRFRRKFYKGQETCMLLKHYIQVKSLNLENIQAYGCARESFVDLPPFANLHHLKLSHFTCEMLMVLLPKAPNLVTLEIEGVIKLDSDDDLRDDFELDEPGCSIHLKAVKFGIVGGNEYELCLAKFVMKNALHLERFTFCHPKLMPNMKAFFTKRKHMKAFKKKVRSLKKEFHLTMIDFSDF